MADIFDLVIIGSGPAGLSAAIYAERARLKTVVLEKSGMSGGQILNTYEVDNYPGLQGINGFDMGMKFREHADYLGAKFKDADVIGITDEAGLKKISTTAGDFLTKTIIIASGASYAKLGISGENQFGGKGVSYCATCDGAFFRNKTTAVIGGGDVAVEDAIFLARTCEKVYLIHRRNELRAAMVLQEALFEQKNIEIIWDSVAEEIQGNDFVEHLSIKNVKTNEKRTLDLQGVFIAVGLNPNSDFLKSVVKMDDKGYVIAEEDGVTNVPGIFVAGDVRTKMLRQIVTAVSDGANAVTSVQHYLISHK